MGVEEARATKMNGRIVWKRRRGRGGAHNLTFYPFSHLAKGGLIPRSLCTARDEAEYSIIVPLLWIATAGLWLVSFILPPVYNIP